MEVKHILTMRLCIYDRLVEIAMEAMDLLLMACHAQTLNLFVESFLRMIQKLMEDANPNLQILATNSVSTRESLPFEVSVFELILMFAVNSADQRDNVSLTIFTLISYLMYSCELRHFCYSLFGLPTSKKTLRHIIDATTFSYRNFHPCAMATMKMLNFAIRFVWLAFEAYKVSSGRRCPMIWSKIFGKSNTWRKSFHRCCSTCKIW